MTDFGNTKLIYFKIFFEVAEAACFSKAAESLNMSPSLVTKDILKLENELGLKLFERSTRFVELTTAGEYLFNACKPLFSELENHINEAVKIQLEKQSTVRLGVMNTADLDKFLFPYLDIENLQKKELPFRIELVSDYMTDLIDRLFNNQLDIIIIPDFLSEQAEAQGMVWRDWAKDNSNVFIPLTNKLSQKSSVTLEELKDETFDILEIPHTNAYLTELRRIFMPYNDNLKIAKKYINAYTLMNVYLPSGDSVLFSDAYVTSPKFENKGRRVTVSDYKNGTIIVWKESNQLARIFFEWYDRSKSL